MAEQHRIRSLSPLGDFDRLYHFNGGLKLAENRAVSLASPARSAGIPPQLILPLQQHIGEAAKCLVQAGDRVHKGDILAEPVGQVSVPLHAPTSGTIAAIETRPVPHPSGLPAPCIVIDTDGKDTAGPMMPPVDYLQTDPASLCELIRRAGIVGLGGAGFPTQVKLARKHDIELLLINGAECEPWITCDERLMIDQAANVISGIRILQHILKPQHCVLAIEDNMPAASAAIRAVLGNGDYGIRLVEVPAIYPTGGERQLIKVITNREVPSMGLPADIGIICQNVGTVAAVHQAINAGRPLLSRLVTVTGDGVREPGNLDVLIGTPVSHVIAAAGGYSSDIERLLIGGPMMGYAVGSDAVPVIKTTNCILAVTPQTMPSPRAALPCIRCGKCTEACPADLLPQQLYWFARSGNHDAAQDFGLFDCIECGCCAYVCPSHIPLVQYYRHAKTTIWAQEKQKQAADIARHRHEARLARLERIKQERADRLEKKKRAVSTQGRVGEDPRQAAIQAALERVKRKKEQAGLTPANTENLTDEQLQQIEAADRRRGSVHHPEDDKG
ncbi:MAG TPA: electron transport complex subunit RsxC [Gammaproteobacteria bacterium]|nr:electron transport complex subunit RsxC [Gammaproteobacteria bacterium]